MIIGLQGTPGSGKTTALTGLTHRQPVKISGIQEIIDTIPSHATSDNYLANDIHKWQAAARSTSQHVVIDRDFTSTLAYCAASSGFNSSEYRELKMNLDMCIAKGKLGLPDHLFRFYLPGKDSIRLQNPDNHESWGDLKFLKIFETALNTIISCYYKNNQITIIDRQFSPLDVIIKIERYINNGESMS